MGPVTEVMPRPHWLAWEFVKPFIVVLGVLVLLLAALGLLVGQNPVVPVGHFLVASAEELAPFAAFLFTLWLLYLVPYVLVGASLSDLSILAGRLRRRLLLSLPGAALVVCLIAPSSLVRLYRPSLPVQAAAGWRPGDSVQLE